MTYSLYSGKKYRDFTSKKEENLLSTDDIVDMFSGIVQLFSAMNIYSPKISTAKIDFDDNKATIILSNKDKISAQIHTSVSEDLDPGIEEEDPDHSINLVRAKDWNCYDIDYIHFKLEGRSWKDVTVHFPFSDSKENHLTKLENTIAGLILDSMSYQRR